MAPIASHGGALGAKCCRTPGSTTETPNIKMSTARKALRIIKTPPGYVSVPNSDRAFAAYSAHFAPPMNQPDLSRLLAAGHARKVGPAKKEAYGSRSPPPAELTVAMTGLA